MTEEQIIQNAEKYADKLYEDGRCTESTAPTIQEIYIAGAHSLDEEIKELNHKYDVLKQEYLKQNQELNLTRVDLVNCKRLLPI